MISFFFIMIHVSTIIAMVASLVFFVGVFFENRPTSNIEVFNTCNNQVKVCRVASLIFVVLYWFVVSGLSTEECLEGYSKLSTACSILGRIWIVLAFVNIVISVIIIISERGKDEMEIMGKLRKSDFVMGAFFLVIAFILKVN